MNLPKDPVIKPIQSADVAKPSSTAKDAAGKDCCDKTQPNDVMKSGTSQQHGQSHEQVAAGSKTAIDKDQRKAQPTKPQQQQGSPMADRLEGKWDQYVGQAKVTWGKLTDDEILKSEGQMQKLAGLVEQRYAITREKADEQVKKFLDSCKSK